MNAWRDLFQVAVPGYHGNSIRDDTTLLLGDVPGRQLALVTAQGMSAARRQRQETLRAEIQPTGITLALRAHQSCGRGLQQILEPIGVYIHLLCGNIPRPIQLWYGSRVETLSLRVSGSPPDCMATADVAVRERWVKRT